MSDCLFCKIVEGVIPSHKLYEDEHVIGFKDLRPLAKSHLLFIHKKHTKDILDLTKHEPDQLKDLFRGIRIYAEQEGLSEKGFRVVTNMGEDAGQTVFHTHLHVLSGEKLGSFGR